MRNKNRIKDMSLDQQIKIYEDRIACLEQMKRNMLSNNLSYPGEKESAKSENYLSRINVDLDKNYQQITILKIRKMMGF
jgi:hypothetical protein